MKTKLNKIPNDKRAKYVGVRISAESGKMLRDLAETEDRTYEAIIRRALILYAKQEKEIET